MKTLHEIIEQRLARNRREKVYQALVNRAPNSVRITTLEHLLPGYSAEAILESAEQLRASNLIEINEMTNQYLPGRVIPVFKVKDVKNLPIIEKINVGDIEFPRLLDGDDANADDINVFIEALAEYDNKIEKRIENLTADMTRRYWADVATLVGLFVSVFALILRSSDPIVVQNLNGASDLFYLKLAELAPLAIILFGFVLMLRFFIKKI
jgi:hypothetical protein